MEGLYTLFRSLPIDALHYTFVVRALIAILLLTPLFGLLGTMAVNHQMAFFSDALGHSALTGIGLGMLLGLGRELDLVSMLIFGIVWALMIVAIKRTGAASADTVISVFSSTSVAAGLVILASGGGFAKYSSLLIGDILTVTEPDLLWLLLALVGGAVLWALVGNGVLLTSINNSLARSRGIRTRLWETAFVVLVAVAVMLSIRWIGVLLINALLIIPAAAGRNLARTVRQHTVWSICIALVAGVSGLFISCATGMAAGPTIVLIAAAFYMISLIVRSTRK